MEGDHHKGGIRTGNEQVDAHMVHDLQYIFGVWEHEHGVIEGGGYVQDHQGEGEEQARPPVVRGGAGRRGRRHENEGAHDGGDETEPVCEAVEDLFKDVISWERRGEGDREG